MCVYIYRSPLSPYHHRQDHDHHHYDHHRFVRQLNAQANLICLRYWPLVLYPFLLTGGAPTRLCVLRQDAPQDSTKTRWHKLGEDSFWDNIGTMENKMETTITAYIAASGMTPREARERKQVDTAKTACWELPLIP